MTDPAETVTITVNGAARELPAGTSVAALVERLGFGGLVAVERNRVIVTRATHATTIVEAGDVFEIVHFVGGG